MTSTCRPHQTKACKWRIIISLVFAFIRLPCFCFVRTVRLYHIRLWGRCLPMMIKRAKPIVESTQRLWDARRRQSLYYHLQHVWEFSFAAQLCGVVKTACVHAQASVEYIYYAKVFVESNLGYVRVWGGEFAANGVWFSIEKLLVVVCGVVEGTMLGVRVQFPAWLSKRVEFERVCLYRKLWVHDFTTQMWCICKDKCRHKWNPTTTSKYL